MPVVHIPCFMLNLIFGFDSDKILMTELTISELPLSISVGNVLGKLDDATLTEVSY